MAQTIMKDLEGYFTPEQIDRILAATKNRRDRMLVMFGWRTGRRISEMLGVKKKDIDFDKGLIKFHILKKKNKDFLKLKPIDSGLLQALLEYTEDMKEDDYIFKTTYKKDSPITRRQAYNIVRGAAEDAKIAFVGLKPPHPHHLRHSFAIHFLRNTKNRTTALVVLQRLLEHSNINTTVTYLQFSQEDLREDLDNVFNKKKEDIK